MFSRSSIQSSKKAESNAEKRKCYKEQNAEKANLYLTAIAEISAEHIAYIDETGIDNYLSEPPPAGSRWVRDGG